MILDIVVVCEMFAQRDMIWVLYCARWGGGHIFRNSHEKNETSGEYQCEVDGKTFAMRLCVVPFHLKYG